MDDLQKLEEKLERLKRNESQMTEDQKKAYCQQLREYKKSCLVMARRILMDFLFSDAKCDPADIQVKDLADRTRAILQDEKESGALREMDRILLRTFSVNEYMKAACRIKDRIWREAYGPYWTGCCSKDDEGRIRNKFIPGYEWVEEFGIWMTPDRTGSTAMFNPMMAMEV